MTSLSPTTGPCLTEPGDDATLRSTEIGLRVIHRSQTKGTRVHRHAKGYVKRAERRQQYLKHKEEVEKENKSDVENIQWCPVEDEELCGEQGELIKALKDNFDKETTGKEEL